MGEVIPNDEAITATWVVRLDCKCPSCNEQVDLLDDVDFWDGLKLGLDEHVTNRSEGVDVTCPKCGNDFEVELEY